MTLLNAPHSHPTFQYTDYVAMRDELTASQREQARLRECLEQILQEVEAKAPALKRQREQYDAALDHVEDLEHKLASAQQENDRYAERVRQKPAIDESSLVLLNVSLLDLGCVPTTATCSAAGAHAGAARDSVAPARWAM